MDPLSPHAVEQNYQSNAKQIGGEHYKKLEPQPWDVIEAWNLGFLDGNVVKYMARWRSKGGLQDLHKARHYLDKLIEREGTVTDCWKDMRRQDHAGDALKGLIQR